jgi:hypothetical protein
MSFSLKAYRWTGYNNHASDLIQRNIQNKAVMDN